MFRRHISLLLALAPAAALLGCQPSDDAESADAAPEAAAEAPATATSTGVVEIIARDFSFEAPTEIPSGWTTFRLNNEGAQEHFAILWLMPEGHTVEDFESQVAPAFHSIMGPYQQGTIDREEAINTLGAALPEWFWSVLPAGGVGLTAPGGVAQTTVKLEPGTYVLECYVKTPEGVFHSMYGMLHPVTVIDDPSGTTPPEADVEMTLANYEIAIEGEFTAGEHTIRVDVVDDPEGLLKHDIHLVRLSAGTTADDVVAWMDWLDALMAPAPAEFLGGAEDMPAGSTAYITVSLAPGTYAWISESYGGQGMVMEFTVD